jgi:hypothetical protein
VRSSLAEGPAMPLDRCIRTLPNASDVVARSRLATLKANENVNTVVGLGPASLAKASEGVMRRATTSDQDTGCEHPLEQRGPIEAIRRPHRCRLQRR